MSKTSEPYTYLTNTCSVCGGPQLGAHHHEPRDTVSQEVWCHYCEDYEQARKTDCCDHLYPYCYLTIHQDGTTECYLCQRQEQEK